MASAIFENNINNLEVLNEEEQSEDICLQAFKQDKKALRLIKNKKRLSENFWREALKIDGMLLVYYVNYHAIGRSPFCKKEIDAEIIKIALRQNSMSIQYLNINQQTEEYWILAVSINGLELKWCKNQTLAICETACNMNPKAFQYASIQTETMGLIAVDHDGMLVEYVIDITLPIAMKAVKQNGYALIIILDRLARYKWIIDYNSKSSCDKYVKCSSCIDMNFEIYEVAVNQNIDILNFKKDNLYEFRTQYHNKYSIEQIEDGFGLFD